MPSSTVWPPRAPQERTARPCPAPAPSSGCLRQGSVPALAPPRLGQQLRTVQGRTPGLESPTSQKASMARAQSSAEVRSILRGCGLCTLPGQPASSVAPVASSEAASPPMATCSGIPVSLAHAGLLSARHLSRVLHPGAAGLGALSMPPCPSFPQAVGRALPSRELSVHSPDLGAQALVPGCPTLRGSVLLLSSRARLRGVCQLGPNPGVLRGILPPQRGRGGVGLN